jgi:hypothetical protein
MPAQGILTYRRGKKTDRKMHLNQRRSAFRMIRTYYHYTPRQGNRCLHNSGLHLFKSFTEQRTRIIDMIQMSSHHTTIHTTILYSKIHTTIQLQVSILHK